MESICFLICGQPRCVDIILIDLEKKFKNYQITFYLCLTSNFKEYEKEYINFFNMDNVLTNKYVKKIVLIKSENDSAYRNSYNYASKIVNLIKIVEPIYDLYFIVRTDLIFEDVRFIEFIKDDFIYFSDKNLNNFVCNKDNIINPSVIITKSYNSLVKLINIDTELLKNNNYLEIFLYYYLVNFNIDYKLLDINYKLILSKCNIIAIAGDSGSGKTTLTNHLLNAFEKDKFCKIETDRYHKWERGDPNYQIYSHLNPYANHLEKMNDDIFKLKIGQEIYSVDYDHCTGKFTQIQKVESKNNILLCGLHTLLNDNTNTLINLKIFMDTDRKLIKKWKIDRDVKERGYDINKVLNQIQFREKDYEEYVKNQKNNADLIIKFYEEINLLKCKLLIQNKYLVEKVLKNIIKKDIKFSYEDEKFCIHVENNYYEIIVNYIKYFCSVD
jgi:uridine kinase